MTKDDAGGRRAYLLGGQNEVGLPEGHNLAPDLARHVMEGFLERFGPGEIDLVLCDGADAALGALQATTKIFPEETFLAAIRQALAAKCAMIPMNEEAFRWGRKAVLEGMEEG